MEVNDKGDLADMMAILADLEQSNACAVIILQGRFKDDMRVRRALYESALISYRRAINGGSTRLPEYGLKLWKFPLKVNMEAIAGLESEASEMKIVADKCIAHRANADARRVEFPSDGSSGSMPFSVELDIKGSGGLARCSWAQPAPAGCLANA